MQHFVSYDVKVFPGDVNNRDIMTFYLGLRSTQCLRCWFSLINLIQRSHRLGGSCVTNRMVKTFSLFDKLLRVYGRPLKSCYASETMCQQDTRGRGLCCTEHRLVLPVITHLHLRNKDGAMLELCSELRVRINLTTEEAAASILQSSCSVKRIYLVMTGKPMSVVRRVHRGAL